MGVALYRSAGLILAAALFGCSSQPAMKLAAPIDSATYAEGYADGRRMMLEDLQSDPAFGLTRQAARHASRKVSWLPHGVERIPQMTWWGSRQTNMELLKACRDGSDAKDRAIRAMRKRVGVDR